MLSLLSKLMKNFVNEVKFLINFFYVEYKLFVLRYYLSTKTEPKGSVFLSGGKAKLLIDKMF